MENGSSKLCMKLLLLTVALLFTPALHAQDPLRVGTIVPTSGPLFEAGQASQAALKAYFDEVNSKGGINGRKLELLVATTEIDSIQRLARDPKVIAFVGVAIAGNEKQISSLIQTEKVPLIGAATLLPPVDPPLNPYGFYIMSGVKEQACALVNFAASKPELRNAPATIIYVDDQLSTASASAAAEQATKVGWNPVRKTVQQANNFNAVSLVEEVKKTGTQTVFFFGPATALRELIQLSAASNIAPTFLSLGATAGSDFSGALTPAFKDKFFLSFPTVPNDITAIAEYRELQQKYDLTAKHVAMQLSTLAAAKVFVEALRRSGKDPSRPTMVTSVEQLQDFETGFAPRMTFTKERRIGSAGAYIITFDPTTKGLTAVGGWVSAY
jgi:ABC-type branched-subunit amino acid transport system substrate-binding protein